MLRYKEGYIFMRPLDGIRHKLLTSWKPLPLWIPVSRAFQSKFRRPLQPRPRVWSRKYEKNPILDRWKSRIDIDRRKNLLSQKDRHGGWEIHVPLKNETSWLWSLYMTSRSSINKNFKRSRRNSPINATFYPIIECLEL